MSVVGFDLSVSLAGFITGPDVDMEQPLGTGGERLHEWGVGLKSWRERHGMSGGATGTDAEILDEAFRNVGAFVMGRNMFDLAVGRWGEEPPFHGPVFVVTHEPRDPLPRQGGTTFTFVEGLEPAIAQAKAAAAGRDVSGAGGADVVRQGLRAGLIDEFQLHLVPILLGDGIRLFDGLAGSELECTRVIESPAVTHLRYGLAGRP